MESSPFGSVYRFFSGMTVAALRVTSRNESPPCVTRFSAVTFGIPYPRYDNASREEWEPLRCTAACRTQHAAHSSPQSTSRSPHRTTYHTASMAEGGSSSWGALRGRASQPTTLTPDEKGGREGLLAFVNITKEASSHSNTVIKCKTCAKKFAGTKERMAAHFALRKGLGVAVCRQPSAEATTISLVFYRN